MKKETFLKKKNQKNTAEDVLTNVLNYMQETEEAMLGIVPKWNSEAGIAYLNSVREITEIWYLAIEKYRTLIPGEIRKENLPDDFLA